jgi:hypothetical protein
VSKQLSVLDEEFTRILFFLGQEFLQESVIFSSREYLSLLFTTDLMMEEHIVDMWFKMQKRITRSLPVMMAKLS